MTTYTATTQEELEGVLRLATAGDTVELMGDGRFEFSETPAPLIVTCDSSAPLIDTRDTSAPVVTDHRAKEKAT